MRFNDVVQFNESHEWCGCLGIVEEVKRIGDDRRYRIGVPIPNKGIACIYVMDSANEVEFIGNAHLGFPTFVYD